MNTRIGFTSLLVSLPLSLCLLTSGAVAVPGTESLIGVHGERGVLPSRVRAVQRALQVTLPRLGRDLRVQFPALRVVLFHSHRSFAAALWRGQRQRAQNEVDNTSAVVHDTLLLGPMDSPYLRHNLAHVTTEWAIDHLTGNRTDALPSTTWLYDGLAEYEAYRLAPSGLACSLHGTLPFDITSLNTPGRWLAVRAGPFGDLAYCMAAVQAGAIVRQVGWPHIVRLLHNAGSWERFAQQMLNVKH